MTDALGIYQIVNTKTGEVYVGSSKHLAAREASHFGALKRGRHSNRKLQGAWAAYGGDAFLFSVIEYVDDEALLRAREKFWIEMLGATGAAGYNLSPTPAGNGETGDTRAAVALVREGMTVYAAAKQLGIAQSTVHRALEREASRCPDCGQVTRRSAPATPPASAGCHAR